MTLGAERTPWRELAAEPTHELLDGYLPVVVTTLRYADLVVRQTVVGYSEELSPDRALLALARLEVRNAHAAAATAHGRCSPPPSAPGCRCTSTRPPPR